MNKIIYKQRNKILLALLVLGGVVHASRYRSCVSGLYNLANCALGYSHRRSATTSEAFTPVVPSDMGHNPGSSNDPSLPGSSGDTTTAQSTQVETGTTLTVINPFTGISLLTSTKLHYSEVIAKIREQLGQGFRVILTQDGQVIPSNTPDKLEGEIGYVRGGSIISVIPSCYDELCSKLQGFIHEDFLKLHRPRPGHYFSFSEDQFHHINIRRVVDRFIWPEEFDEDGRHLINTDALQSDVIETLKVLCDNIDSNDKSITEIRRYLAETPTRLQFEFLLSTESPNIILIDIKTPPEYDLYNLACLDKDGNFVLKSYSTDLPEWI